jgi:transaldolase/predicted transcriptional regulator
MRLFLESSDLRETEKAVKSGLVNGIVANPELINRYGSGDTDSLIVKLAGLSDTLQIELTGDSFEFWVTEAQRIMSLGLAKDKVIFRLPITENGLIACRELVSKGYCVNIMFIYTINQAYLAMQSGASMIELMADELLQQGYDVNSLIEETISMRDKYKYDTKISVAPGSSVGFLRASIKNGVDAFTFTGSSFAELKGSLLSNPAADRFLRKSRLISLKVKDVLKGKNPRIKDSSNLLEAVVEMTQGGMGAVAVLNSADELLGVFTDGDLRRQLQTNGEQVLLKSLSELNFKSPITIDAQSSLEELSKLFKDKRIDNVLVTENNKLVGMVDIQDLNL